MRAATVARADGWSIWQLELVPSRGAEPRWREVAALALAAIQRLAARGLPATVAQEVATLAEAQARFRSRPPTAVELAADLQQEPSADWAVLAARSYIGTPEALAASASAAAAALAATSPVVTLWCRPEAMDSLDFDGRMPPPQLPSPLPSEAAQLRPLLLEVPLSAVPLSLRPSELAPPPRNPWAPSVLAPPSALMESRGYRYE